MWDSIEKNDLVGCLRALALGAIVEDTCENTEEATGVVVIQSSVQRATQLKNWNVVALLLLWGADAEYCDSLGRNLIHYLASIPDSSISVLLSILRKHPSLGGCPDREGRTGLQYAEMAENAPVATIIRVFQAQVDEANRSPLKSAAAAGNPALLSGQDTPEMPESPKPTNNTNNSNQLANAFEKVLQLTQKGPFKRSK